MKLEIRPPVIKAALKKNSPSRIQESKLTKKSTRDDSPDELRFKAQSKMLS